MDKQNVAICYMLIGLAFIIAVMLMPINFSMSSENDVNLDGNNKMATKEEVKANVEVAAKSINELISEDTEQAGIVTDEFNNLDTYKKYIVIDSETNSWISVMNSSNYCIKPIDDDLPSSDGYVVNESDHKYVKITNEYYDRYDTYLMVDFFSDNVEGAGELMYMDGYSYTVRNDLELNTPVYYLFIGDSIVSAKIVTDAPGVVKDEWELNMMESVTINVGDKSINLGEVLEGNSNEGEDSKT